MTNDETKEKLLALDNGEVNISWLVEGRRCDWSFPVEQLQGIVREREANDVDAEL